MYGSFSTCMYYVYSTIWAASFKWEQHFKFSNLWLCLLLVFGNFSKVQNLARNTYHWFFWVCAYWKHYTKEELYGKNIKHFCLLCVCILEIYWCKVLILFISTLLYIFLKMRNIGNTVLKPKTIFFLRINRFGPMVLKTNFLLITFKHAPLAQLA